VNHRNFERTLRCDSQCRSMSGRVSFPNLTLQNLILYVDKLESQRIKDLT
jgi:hypothetical protein